MLSGTAFEQAILRSGKVSTKALQFGNPEVNSGAGKCLSANRMMSRDSSAPQNFSPIISKYAL
jgi:hypothetical protein